MEESPSRKLAVILHADVVGSTALVQGNETVAHERIRDTFERLSEAIHRQGGAAREIRGDALVAEFTKASDAVEAALSFQTANASYLQDLADDIKPIVRVGIAMGEVVVADETITGEAVVLAQRLEQLAVPGGVCIQGTAQDTVPKRLPYIYEKLDEQTLKGFREPVRAYSVGRVVDASSAEPGAAVQAEPVSLELPDKPSVAVLPFSNMSDDPEQEYFSDGISEDIITELSRFRSLFVVARNSSFHYKGQSPKVQEVGRELGVQYIVEGSVRKAANRIRITAQLVEASSGKHIWAERYDRQLEDIFSVQDELVRIIVTTVGGQIEASDQHRAERLTKSELTVFDFVLRAQAAFLRTNKADNVHAVQFAECALEVDPENARANCILAGAWFLNWMAHWVPNREQAMSTALAAAKKAVGLDKTDSVSLTILGEIQLFRREFEEAGYHIERALEVNPNDSLALGVYGLYLTSVGRASEAVTHYDDSARINPLDVDWISWLRGITLFTARQYDEAISVLRTIQDPINEVRGWLAASYAKAGRLDEARAKLQDFLEAAKVDMAKFPGDTLSDWEEYWHGAIAYEDAADFEHLLEALRLAGMPN